MTQQVPTDRIEENALTRRDSLLTARWLRRPWRSAPERSRRWTARMRRRPRRGRRRSRRALVTLRAHTGDDARGRTTSTATRCAGTSRGGRPGTQPRPARPRWSTCRRCKPIKAAVVDIWHCAREAGRTPASTQEGTDGDTFMRGIQRTTKNGIATFTTVYPGWYSGRTVHIHVQVSPRRQRPAHRAALLAGAR